MKSAFYFLRLIFIYLIKIFLFWMTYFAFAHLAFLVYYFKNWKNETPITVIQLFWQAVPLDISASGYLMLLSLILAFLHFIFPLKIWLQINRIYVFIMVVIVSLVCSADLILYHEWGAKIHYKIFVHLQHPAEIFETATFFHYFIFWGVFFIYTIPFLIFYQKFNHKNIPLPPLKFISRIGFGIVFFLSGSFILILGIRGGFRQMPVNQSIVYYAKNNILNAAAINPPWNLIHSVIENRKSLTENPFVYYDLKSAEKRTRKLFEVEKDTTIRILSTEKPNIVLFMLEGWSTDLMKCYNSDIDVTPNFDSLSRDGLLFSNIYSSGWTSDFGNAAILSSYPALSIACIVAQESKFNKIKCVNEILEQQGYKTSYFFGGELNYGNIKSYLAYHGFDELYEQKDFPSGYPSGRLGIHDEFVFPFQLEKIKTDPQPFFSVIFNVSSHSPFDMPVDTIIQYGSEENMYINSVHYSDKCLGKYFEEARKQPWYDNTLFILIADHSHSTHKQNDYTAPGHYTIPFLFYGKVIKNEFLGEKINKIGCQTDLLGTLLPQLNLKSDDFRWSKNLLNPYTKEFAHFTHPAGFGWVTPGGKFSYHYQINSFLEENFSDLSVKDSIIKDGKCYMQSVFQEFADF